MDDLNATAEALAGEAMPADQTPTDAPEMTEDEALAAAFDAASGAAEAEPAAEPEAEAKPEEGKEPEAEAEDAADEEEASTEDEAAVEAPNGLPRALREQWKDMPEAARDEVSKMHREMSLKLTEQGRMIQGIGPIRDVLADAVKDLPQLANMRPQDVANETMQLARWNAAFKAGNADALFNVIEHYGMAEKVAARYGGEGGGNAGALQDHIAKLEQKIEQLSDPNRITSLIDQRSAEDSARQITAEFASTAPHWEDVEDDLPGFIPVAQQVMPQGASQRDILQKAYDLATHARGLVAKQPDAEKAAPAADPEKAQKAAKALSINAKSKPSGKTRTLTEDEELAAIFDRASRG